MGSRLASLLGIAGICCGAWELGRQNGRSEAMEMSMVSKGPSCEGNQGMKDGAAIEAILAGSEDTQTASVAGSVSGREQEGGSDDVNRTKNGSGLPWESGEHLAALEDAAVSLGAAAVSKQARRRPATVPTGEQHIASLVEEDGSYPATVDRFWEAYAVDRYNWLLGGLGGEVETGEEAKGMLEDMGRRRDRQAKNANGRGGDPTSRRNPIKYLVFKPKSSGLGNHMSGMMSAFALSVATKRVFLHEWTISTEQCGATYADLFVPPFEPWSISTTPGSRVSARGHLLGSNQDETADHRSRKQTETKKKQGLEQQQETVGGLWDGAPGLVSAAERKRCHLGLDMKGVASGEFTKVLIDKRGQDPRPDCPILFVTCNQFFVEFVTSNAYGSPTIGGRLLSEWMQPGNATATLFAGLFRPVPPVRRKIEDAVANLFPTVGQSMAAHARAWHLENNQKRNTFVACLGRLGAASNISTVVLATDIPHFDKDATSMLKHKGITVVSMEGVQRTGESAKMRNSVEKIRNAVVDMFLMGKADIAVTSPKSSFSALGAAAGGQSTRRVGWRWTSHSRLQVLPRTGPDQARRHGVLSRHQVKRTFCSVPRISIDSRILAAESGTPERARRLAQ